MVSAQRPWTCRSDKFPTDWFCCWFMSSINSLGRVPKHLKTRQVVPAFRMHPLQSMPRDARLPGRPIAAWHPGHLDPSSPRLSMHSHALWSRCPGVLNTECQKLTKNATKLPGPMERKDGRSLGITGINVGQHFNVYTTITFTTVLRIIALWEEVDDSKYSQGGITWCCFWVSSNLSRLSLPKCRCHADRSYLDKVLNMKFGVVSNFAVQSLRTPTFCTSRSNRGWALDALATEGPNLCKASAAALRPDAWAQEVHQATCSRQCMWRAGA